MLQVQQNPKQFTGPWAHFSRSSFSPQVPTQKQKQVDGVTKNESALCSRKKIPEGYFKSCCHGDHLDHHETWAMREAPTWKWRNKHYLLLQCLWEQLCLCAKLKCKSLETALSGCLKIKCWRGNFTLQLWVASHDLGVNSQIMAA